MQNVAQTSATKTATDDIEHAPVLFETSGAERTTRTHAGPPYTIIQHGAEFRRLRGRFRRFTFPMTLLFIIWYLVYVLLADYAHGFMSTPVFGEVNVGILLGLGQFVSTALISAAYLWYARRRLDPQAEKVRRQAGA